MTYHLVTTSFEIGVCPWPDLSSLFQYTSPTPIVSLHLISRILYHPGIPVTLLTGSSLYQIFAWIFTTPKLITSEAKDLSGGLSSFIIVLKLLLLESVVLARRRNAVDAMPLVTGYCCYCCLVIGYCCLVSLSRDFSGQYYPPLQG